MLAIDTTSAGLVPIVVSSANAVDFATAAAVTGHPFIAQAPHHHHHHHQSAIFGTTGLPTSAVSVSAVSQATGAIVSAVPLTHHLGPLKRGSDELLSVTNGSGMSPTLMDANSDAKKLKVEPTINTKPSRVLHFRGVPAETTEGEIVQLGMPFGKMTNLVLAKKKNQALLEMGDVPSAQAMVNYYFERPPSVRGRPIYIQFSNHTELKTEQSSQNAGAQAALQAANQLLQNMGDGSAGGGGEPRTVLRVVVENMLYPVTIDVFTQIFSRFGQVLKIVTFNKNGQFQALIQYSDQVAASTAKHSLNGQNIYNGCCTLRIDFSKLAALNVRFNNDKSRDFTNPGLTSDGGGLAGGLGCLDSTGRGLAGGLGAFGAHMGAGPIDTTQLLMRQGGAAIAASTPVHPGSSMYQAAQSPAIAHPAPNFSPNANVFHNPYLGAALQHTGMREQFNPVAMTIATSMPQPIYETASVSPNTAAAMFEQQQQQAALAMQQNIFAAAQSQAAGFAGFQGEAIELYPGIGDGGHMGRGGMSAAFGSGGSVGGGGMGRNIANLMGGGNSGNNRAGGGMGSYNDSPMPFGLAGPMPGATGQYGLRFPGSTAGGTVLLVSNLNEEKNVSPDALFTLFGVYGDVIRVKIMFNKKDNALVQFADAAQAQTAMTHLDKITLWGKQLKIAPSKHAIVQLPREGQPDAGLTKDYSNSPLHRFKKPHSKNYQNIYPPSATLHLSNIPPTTTDEQLLDLFKEHGNVEGFKFFQKDRKMALIQMSTVEEAIEALIATHNHQLAETSHLRVSFSKSTIRQNGTPPPPEVQLQQAQAHAQAAAAQHAHVLAMAAAHAAAAHHGMVMVPHMM